MQIRYLIFYHLQMILYVQNTFHLSKNGISSKFLQEAVDEQFRLNGKRFCIHFFFLTSYYDPEQRMLDRNGLCCYTISTPFGVSNAGFIIYASKIKFQFKRNIKNHKKIMRNKEKIHLLADTTISHYITL